MKHYCMKKQISAKLLIILFLHSALLFACKKNQNPYPDEPSGFLNAGESVFVKYKMNGQVYESLKINGKAIWKDDNLLIEASNTYGKTMYIVMYSMDSLGAYSLNEKPMEFTSTYGASTVSASVSFPGTSFNIEINDTISISSTEKAVKGTFSGFVYDTDLFDYYTITDGEFWGGIPDQ